MKLVIVFLTVLTLSGCASMQSTQKPGADFTQLKSFYVQLHPGDDSEVGKAISDQLKLLGYKSTYGIAESPASAVDATLTYLDSWRWDVTMWLFQLNIQIRDAKTKELLASGTTTRPSLQRQRPEIMANEILRKVLDKKDGASTADMATNNSQSSAATAIIATPQSQPVAQTHEEKLRELKRLNDAGLISKEVYLEQQKTILSKP
jgi:hypothetical protein